MHSQQIFEGTPKNKKTKDPKYPRDLCCMFVFIKIYQKRSATPKAGAVEVTTKQHCYEKSSKTRMSGASSGKNPGAHNIRKVFPKICKGII